MARTNIHTYLDGGRHDINGNGDLAGFEVVWELKQLGRVWRNQCARRTKNKQERFGVAVPD